MAWSSQNSDLGPAEEDAEGEVCSDSGGGQDGGLLTVSSGSKVGLSLKPEAMVKSMGQERRHTSEGQNLGSKVARR